MLERESLPIVDNEEVYWAVFAGGASRGAHEVGAVLAKAMSKESWWYHGFSGVSVGALIATFLSKFKDRIEAAHALVRLWESLETKDVYKNHFPLGYLHGLWKTGLIDTSPLAKTVGDNFEKPVKPLRIGVVNWQTHQYEVFNENSPHLYFAILASAAFPVFFPTVPIERHHYVDGGVIRTTPLMSAIKAGATHIDVYLSGPRDREVNRAAPKNVLDVGAGTLEIMSNRLADLDLTCTMLYSALADAGHPLGIGKKSVKIRIIEPEEDLPGEPFDFSSKLAHKLIDLGHKVGLKTFEY